MSLNKGLGFVLYTYELPYEIRRRLCELLDSDRSWERLGGEYLKLDTVQLGLISHAILRRASPTEELLAKCELSNLRISDLYEYLSNMNHNRAMALLEPYLKKDQIRHQVIDIDNTNIQREQVIRDVGAEGNKCHRQKLNDDESHEVIRNETPDDKRGTAKRGSLADQEVVNQLRLIMQISYKELRSATDDFSDTNILGNGGFACVYRGNWKGTEVAIKRLKCNLMDQAINELTILNSYRIDNILPIYGISLDGPVACLVYQFMINGSLEDRLSCKHHTPPLNWSQRATIAEGVAKGLFYLHNLRAKPIVHGDIKSANILLDAQFNPKLGDFGLSRQLFNDVDGSTSMIKNYTHCTVSSIHGTSVYLPSEYLRHKILSPAVDVYSYGIVLLEMATGHRAFNGKRHLIDIIEEEMNSMPPNQISYRLKDRRLENDTQTDIKIWYELLIKLGLACANKTKSKRPPMSKVLDHFAKFKAREKANLSSHDSVLPGDSARGSSFNDRQAGVPSPFTPPITGGAQPAELATIRARSLVKAIQADQQQVNDSSLAMDIDEPHMSPIQLIHKESHLDTSIMLLGEPQVEPIIPLLTELGQKN